MIYINFHQNVCSLGINTMILALLAPQSTSCTHTYSPGSTQVKSRTHTHTHTHTQTHTHSGVVLIGVLAVTRSLMFNARPTGLWYCFVNAHLSSSLHTHTRTSKKTAPHI